MPRYYFHTRDNNSYEKDNEGIDLPDVETAMREAVRAAREMTAELVLQGQWIDGRRLVVTDDSGHLMGEITFQSLLR